MRKMFDSMRGRCCPGTHQVAGILCHFNRFDSHRSQDPLLVTKMSGCHRSQVQLWNCPRGCHRGKFSLLSFHFALIQMGTPSALAPPCHLLSPAPSPNHLHFVTLVRMGMYHDGMCSHCPHLALTLIPLASCHPCSPGTCVQTQTGTHCVFPYIFAYKCHSPFVITLPHPTTFTSPLCKQECMMCAPVAVAVTSWASSHTHVCPTCCPTTPALVHLHTNMGVVLSPTFNSPPLRYKCKCSHLYPSTITSESPSPFTVLSFVPPIHLQIHTHLHM